MSAAGYLRGISDGPGACAGDGCCSDCAMPCETCDKQSCICCTTCGGAGGHMESIGGRPLIKVTCTECNGTGRAKAVA